MALLLFFAFMLFAAQPAAAAPAAQATQPTVYPGQRYPAHRCGGAAGRFGQYGHLLALAPGSTALRAALRRPQPQPAQRSG